MPSGMDKDGYSFILVTFLKADRDQKGFITAAEDECFVGETDINGDGQTSFEEFVAMFMSNKDEVVQSQLKIQFCIMDRDCNGFVTAAELVLELSDFEEDEEYFGEYVDEFVKGHIKEADIDGDGRGSFEEYATLMTL